METCLETCQRRYILYTILLRVMVTESVMILLAKLKIKRPDATCFAVLFAFKR